MLDRLSVDDFTPHVAKTFGVGGPAGGIDLVLAEAAAVGAAPAGRRAPFSLVFRGPRTPVLPQAIYPFQHPTLGTLEIFIVPIGPDAGGMRYEAVFT